MQIIMCYKEYKEGAKMQNNRRETSLEGTFSKAVIYVEIEKLSWSQPGDQLVK